MVEEREEMEVVVEEASSMVSDAMFIFYFRSINSRCYHNIVGEKNTN
jgi:hypothetical protein